MGSCRWRETERERETQRQGEMKSTSNLRKPFTPYFQTKQYDEESRQVNFASKTTWLIILLIFLTVIFCLTLIIVGSLHADRDFADSLNPGVIHTNCSIIELCGCPGQPVIPWYLIISGLTTIIFLLARILICRCCRGKKCDFSYLVIYDLVMFLITTVTLSVGTHFITELSDRINYATHRPNTDTCDFTLFWFSYTVMILGWISVLLVLVWLVNKYGRTLFNCMTCIKYGY